MADLVSLVIDHLHPVGPGRWLLLPAARRALVRRLDAAFLDPSLSRNEVARLLKLISVIQEDRAYAGIDEALIEMLRMLPSALAVLARFRGRVEGDRARELLMRFEDEAPITTAPHVARRVSGLTIKDVFAPPRVRG